MQGHYPQYDGRKIHNLDGIWDFHFINRCPDPLGQDLKQISYDELMAVPGVYDLVSNGYGRRGTGFYRTRVQTENSRLRFKCDGLGLWGAVFWDGRLIGTDHLPYTGMEFDFESEIGEHELVVAVDNQMDFARSPLYSAFYDYYAHGGLYRHCELQELAGTWSFDRAKVTPLDLDGRVRIELLLTGILPEVLSFRYAFDGGESVEMSLPVRDCTVTFETSVPRPSLWSPESPALHTVRFSSDGGESLTERFGLRVVATANGRILLNGKPLRLKGFCRHESHPEFGPALPEAVMLEDLALLKEMNCNFIRGSHYAQDPRFLDLCDRMGFLVWEEGIGWGDPEKHLLDPGFFQAQVEQYPWIIKNSYNNPSVILRGFMNEGYSNLPASRPLYEKIAETIRTNDPGRPITFASMFHDRDINLDLADVISYNCYPGWYTTSQEPHPLSEIPSTLDKHLANLDSLGFGDKPFILSEIGAGAIYGWHDRFRVHWSEEYQTDYLETVCRYLSEHPRICGISLWQYCDGRTSPVGERALGRPRSFNNKGIVDEYRRPKMAFETVKEWFGSIS